MITATGFARISGVSQETVAKALVANAFREGLLGPHAECDVCQRRLPVAAFRKHVNGFLRRCKGCDWRTRWPSEIPVQACVECGETKTFDHFGRTGRNWHRTCLACALGDCAVRMCVSCGVKRPLADFSERTNRHGKRYLARTCKPCAAAAARPRVIEYEKANYQRLAESRRKRRADNRDEYLAKKREWEYAKRRRLGMREIQKSPRVDKAMALFDTRHVRALRHIAKKTMPRSGWTVREIAAWRMRNDPRYVINMRMRVQIRKALRGQKAGRRWESLVGYTYAELAVHLQRQMPRGYSMADLFNGRLHIDHIVPKSTFNVADQDELRACWALSNLRPVPAAINLRKGAKRVVLI